MRRSAVCWLLLGPELPLGLEVHPLRTGRPWCSPPQHSPPQRRPLLQDMQCDVRPCRRGGDPQRGCYVVEGQSMMEKMESTL